MKRKNKARPPRLGQWILKKILPSEERRYFVEGIEERYVREFKDRGWISALFWYLKDILCTIPLLIIDNFTGSAPMIKNYIKIALRNIKKHKGYSTINIMGLAIGIMCCLFIFLYVLQELSYDRYHKDADRIYRIICNWKRESMTTPSARIAFPIADVVAERFDEVESIGRLDIQERMPIRYGEKSFYESGLIAAEPEIFDIFHIPLLKGGPVSKLAAPSTIILTERMAEKYLGSENPIGKFIQVNNTGFEIIGVVQNSPANTHLRYNFFASIRNFKSAGEMRVWTLSAVYTYVKLNPGIDTEAFDSKIRNISDSFISKDLPFSSSHLLQPVTAIHLYSLLSNELKVPGNKAYVLIFSVVGMLVLMIAAVNFINLTTARSVNRSREVGMRKVIGAQRSQIIRQFLLESSVIALSAVVLSVGITYIFMPYFIKVFRIEIAFTDIFRPVVFLMLLVCTLVVGIGAGSYPALFLSAFKPVSILKGSKKGISPSRSRLRQILVVLQFATSIVLIICTLVMYRQINYMKNASLGFDKKHKLIIQAPGAGLEKKIDLVKSEYLSHSAVKKVSVSSSIPGGDRVIWGLDKPEQTKNSISANHLFVCEDFLHGYGIELIAGRNFRGYKNTDAQACILNEKAVFLLGWSSPEEALGEQLNVGPEGNIKTVIGVIRDFHLQGLQSMIEPLVIDYIHSLYGYLATITLNINTDNLKQVLVFAEEIWKKIFPGRPFEYTFLDEEFNNLYKTEEVHSRAFRVFALIGLIVACLGLLGLASFAAEQRTKEIGVRKVLGASASEIVKMLSLEFIKWVLIANAFAFPVAYFVMNRWLQNFAYRTSIGLWVFILSALMALILAVITVSFQAIKAATANPVDSLRYE